MRNVINIAMFLLGIWTIMTGIIEETPRAIGSPAHHIFAASAFVVVLCIHVWLNKKAFLQRFKGLGVATEFNGTRNLDYLSHNHGASTIIRLERRATEGSQRMFHEGMMRHNSIGRRNKTRFIQLNTKLCKACWSCIEVCENNVIGKVELFFHRHARIKHAEECKGCKKCVRVCPHEAIIYTYVPSGIRDQ